jgi:iron complex transport system substrate-binding protein
MVSACDQKSPPPSASRRACEGELRLVSLSPAISRTLIDLAIEDCIVGRTPYCDSIDQSIPVVGDLTNVNFEALVRLNPTHLLVQPPAAGVDPHLQRVARERGWIIGAWRLNTIDDIRTMLREMPASIYDDKSDERETLAGKARRLSDEIESALAPAKQESELSFTGRVLMVNDVNPVMAFGADTYLDDILHALGGTNAVTDRGWVQLSLEDVVRLAPDAIVLVRPGANAASLTDDLGPLATIDAPAVRDGRLALLAHRDALAPSSGVIGVAEEMTAILRDLARAH